MIPTVLKIEICFLYVSITLFLSPMIISFLFKIIIPHPYKIVKDGLKSSRPVLFN